jgi:2-polyprenyl-3-methyl-5-hydroxy-6-metoxy-1,4-benzoquinol methylase
LEATFSLLGTIDMKRVGAEIRASDRWQAVGKTYAETIEGAYHQHRLAVIDALLPPFTGKRVIDFGCGEGVLIRKAIAKGASNVVGIDIDRTLLDLAADSGASDLILGSVDQLADVGAADILIAANVAAYFTRDEDEAFYVHAKRILAGGGHLVITHSNELFDAFTFNAYTVGFYQRNFGCDPTSLLVHPDKPARNTFNVRENPLAYPTKLASAGFSVFRMEYMNYHAQPPLLGKDDPDDMQRVRQDTLLIPPEDRWKLNFQCSMFGVRARAE